MRPKEYWCVISKEEMLPRIKEKNRIEWLACRDEIDRLNNLVLNSQSTDPAVMKEYLNRIFELESRSQVLSELPPLAVNEYKKSGQVPVFKKVVGMFAMLALGVFILLVFIGRA
jgi:hypothetical protein